jgi:hypothetical protein
VYISSTRLRPSLVGLSLTPAPCYSAREARAGGVRKRGFFRLLVHFMRREKNSFPTTVAGLGEARALEALSNMLLILHAVSCMSLSLFWWPLLKGPFMVRCFAAVKRHLMHPAAQQTSPKVGSVRISLKPCSIYVDGQGFRLSTTKW